MTTDELIDRVRCYAAEHCPRTAAVRFVLSPEEGQGACGPYLSVLVSLTSATGLTAGGDGTAAVHLSPSERRVLRAVADLDQESPTGEEIAEKAHMRYEAHFKKLLSAMRTRGLLGGRRGEVGYPITPAGLAALDGESRSDNALEGRP